MGTLKGRWEVMEENEQKLSRLRKMKKYKNLEEGG